MRPALVPILRAAEFWLVVGSTGLFVRAFSREAHLQAMIEAALLAAILTTVAFLKPVRSLFTRMPPLHRGIALGVVGLAVIGQLAGRVHYTFPFVAWTMYSLPPEIPETASHYEVLGIAGDERRLISPGDVIPGHMRMYVKMSRLLARATAEGATELDRSKADETLRALGRAYNASAPTAGPIDAVEVRQCRFALLDYAEAAAAGRERPWGDALLEREVIRRVDLEVEP